MIVGKKLENETNKYGDESRCVDERIKNRPSWPGLAWLMKAKSRQEDLVDGWIDCRQLEEK